MKKKRFLAIVVALLMLVTVFAGCGNNEPIQPPPPPLGENGDDPDPNGDGWHPVFDLLPNTALSGFFNPHDIPDRTDIDMALPFVPADPDNIVIGWTEISLGDPFFAAVYATARRVADDWGWTLLFDVAEHDLALQSAQIDSFIARGVDIIVVDPTDVVGVTAPIRRAVEAGIPVIGFGSEIFGAPVITSITGNTFYNGFVAGRHAGMYAFDPNEQIVSGVILGVMGNSTAESRVNGMVSGFIYGRSIARGEPISMEDAVYYSTGLFQSLIRTGTFNSDRFGIRCVAIYEGIWTEAGGLAGGEVIIAAAGDELNLIWAENDTQGSGAVRALRNFGLTDQVRIVSPGNGKAEFFALIEEGYMIANASHSPIAFVEATFDMIRELAEGTNTWDANNLPGLTAFDPIVFHADNWRDFYDPDPNNNFHIVPPLRILTVPELRQAVLDGTYLRVFTN